MRRPEAIGLLLALCCILIAADEQYYCAWYGECGFDIERGFPRTCVAKNVTAKPVNDPDAEGILQKRCPHFFENDGLYNILKYISARSVSKHAIGRLEDAESGVSASEDNYPRNYARLRNSNVI